MLSREMYSVLSNIPSPTGTISYETLFEKCPNLNALQFSNLVNQAAYPPCDYISATAPIEKSSLSLKEKGLAAIEEYEAFQENQKIVETSLRVATAAKNAAIASAIAAFLALIPQLPSLIDFLAQLMGF